MFIVEMFNTIKTIDIAKCNVNTAAKNTEDFIAKCNAKFD